MNLNNILVPSVQKLLVALNVKVLTYTEIKADKELKKVMDNIPVSYQGFYEAAYDVIGLDDNNPISNANEVILHELIHWSGHKDRLARECIVNWSELATATVGSDDFKQALEVADQEEATAQIGMLKLVLVLGLNAAEYAELTIDYLEKLENIDLDKADRDSDKAVEYLVGFIGMKKVA